MREIKRRITLEEMIEAVDMLEKIEAKIAIIELCEALEIVHGSGV